MLRVNGARFTGTAICAGQYHRPRTASLARYSAPFFSSRHKSNSASVSQQPSNPFEGYYEDLLDRPLHTVTNLTRSVTTPPPLDELPTTEKDVVLQKARVIFGSRLAGPVERQAAIKSASTNIAGILVPPKPDEPDNCCMSGCVNCVWDLYRDEMEEWAAKSAEAREKLGAQRARHPHKSGQPGMPSHVAASLDDDGGGTASNWEDEKSMEIFGTGNPDKDLFEGIPVGIREFMKTEKKLKERQKKAKSEQG